MSATLILHFDLIVFATQTRQWLLKVGWKCSQTVPPNTTSFSSTRARIEVECDCRPTGITWQALGFSQRLRSVMGS
jgi:hypothetical protein